MLEIGSSNRAPLFQIPWEVDERRHTSPVVITSLLREQVPILDFVDWQLTSVQFGEATSRLPLKPESTNQHFTRCSCSRRHSDDSIENRPAFHSAEHLKRSQRQLKCAGQQSQCAENSTHTQTFSAPVNCHPQQEVRIMKTPIQLTVPRHTLIHRVLIGLLMGAVLASPTMAESSNERFQYNTLFSPTESQLKAEARGRVMVYSGLGTEVVEHALDKQFARIEHMMFIGIRQRQADDDGGEEDSVDDDGC